MWVKVVHDIEETKVVQTNLKTSWNWALANVHFAEHGASKIKGPISATVNALSSAGWKPAEPRRWRNEDNGEEIRITKNTSAESVGVAMQNSLDSKAWEKHPNITWGGDSTKEYPTWSPQGGCTNICGKMTNSWRLSLWRMRFAGRLGWMEEMVLAWRVYGAITLGTTPSIDIGSAHD